MSGKETKASTKARASRKDVAVKSPERKATRGRPPKSPARSPARGKSPPKRASKATKTATAPARKTPPRSPVKKSPSRQSPARKTLLRTKSPTRKEKEPPVQKLVPVINLDDSSSESDTPTTSSIRTRSKGTPSKEHSIEIVNNLRSRAAHTEPADRFTQIRPYEPVRRINEFSDEDDIDVGKAPAATVGHGKTVVILLYILFELAIVFGVPLLCSDAQCDYRWLTRQDADKIPASFDLSILLSFVAFILFNGIVSIVPIGGRKYASMSPHGGKFHVVLNGLFALVVQVALLIALEVYHIPVTMFIINNYLSFNTAAVAFSLAMAVLLFAKASSAREDNLNPEYRRNSHVVNFIMGSEVNPRFGPIDVKFVLVRCCIVASILIELSLVYQSMEMISTPSPSSAPSAWSLQLIQNVRIRPTLFVLATMNVVYMADQFFFESAVLSMMEFKTEPWGFLKMIEYLAGIFVYCANAKYVYDYNVELASWELGLWTAVFLSGYVLYRGSNSQKHVFKENPYSPLVAKFDSIPTGTGKKILCSGYWGVVRHPNYFGDILLTAAMIRFVWPSPILVVLAVMICNLVMRAVLDNRRCRQRYGNAWDRYCQRVPYLLIPKVF